MIDFKKRFNCVVLVDGSGEESGAFNMPFSDLVRLAQLLGVVQSYLSGYRLSHYSFADACELIYEAHAMTNDQVATAKGQLEDEMTEIPSWSRASPINLDDLQVRAIDALSRRQLSENAKDIENPYDRIHLWDHKNPQRALAVCIDPVDIEDILMRVLASEPIPHEDHGRKND